MKQASDRGFTIRPATSDDADAICRVHVASIRKVCAADYAPEQIEAWAGPKRPEHYVKAMAAGERMWVAVADDRVVGFVCLNGDEVLGLYIAPAALRRGIGSALLEAAESSARDIGIGMLRLNSTLTAEPFYRSQGYASGPRIEFQFGSVGVPCVPMTKSFRSA